MKKHVKHIIYAIVIVIFIAYITVISPKAMQNDTFWSIEVGEKIVNEGIFGIDDFSIHEGLYYVAHHFLTDILIYVVYSFAGFNGLYILEVVLALVIAGMLYLLNKEISGSKATSAVFLFIQMFMMSMFIAVRAQMISFILFILELLLLEKYKKESKLRYIVGLSIIPILLANFHMGTVPFYFIILGVYFISFIKIKLPFLQSTEQTDKLRVKQLILVGVIGLATIFINPYFVDGVIYPFKTFGNSFINSTIAEFQPFNIAIDGGWTLAYIALVIIMLFISRRRIELGDVLLILGTLFMSFVSVRYISLFVICSAVVLRYAFIFNNLFNFNEEEAKAMKAAAVVFFVLITITLLARYMLQTFDEYIPEQNYPVKAVEFLKKEISDEDKIFNFYDWGSYLMLNDIKVYIDSRCDLYTKEYNGTEIADDYNKLMQCDKTYKEIIEKYDINTFIIPVDVPLETLLEENAQFERVYSDEVAVIYMAK